MMKYIYAIGGSALIGAALIVYFWIAGLNSTIEKKNTKIAGLESNVTQLESQVGSLEKSIEFLEEQKEITEGANAELQNDLEEARDFTVPERIRTITVTAQEDPVQAQIIAREEMTNVLTEIESTTASPID